MAIAQTLFKIRDTMKTNEKLRAEILQIITNQIKANKPAEVRETLERLKGLGYTNEDARILIGQCVMVEIFNAMKHHKPYDEQRYLRNLRRLPEPPLDSD